MKDLLDDMISAPVEQMSFAGYRDGPHLHVSGPNPVLRMVADRMAAIPSLPYLRGRVSLGATEAFRHGAVDDHLRLPAQTDPATAFATILARATVLGMISGRGVPHSALMRERSRAA